MISLVIRVVDVTITNEAVCVALDKVIITTIGLPFGVVGTKTPRKNMVRYKIFIDTVTIVCF